MICENCKQRPATVTVTMTKDDEQYVKHYCEVCSGQQDILSTNQQSQPMSIEQIFSSWFGIPAWSVSPPTSKEVQQDTLQCDACDMTYEQFLHDGKFNCPHCYVAFGERLPAVFKRLHNGAIEHSGKIPEDLNESYQLKKEIEKIRQQMKKAIDEEAFEEAAALRDQVKEIEQRLTQGGVKDHEN